MKNKLKQIQAKLNYLNLTSLANTLTEVQKTIDLIPEDLPKDSYYEEVEHQLQQQDLIQQEKHFSGTNYSITGNIRDVLEENDIRIIDNTFRPSHLGSGSYGKVYQALYQGKEVAVKISCDDSDFKVWTEIINVRNQLPKSNQKHLPKIYALIKAPKINITVLEKLKPTNENLAPYFLGGDFYAQKQKNHYFQRKIPTDINTLQNFAKYITQVAAKYTQSARRQRVKNKIYNQTLELLYQNPNKEYVTLISEINEIIQSNISNQDFFSETFLPKEFSLPTNMPQETIPYSGYDTNQELEKEIKKAPTQIQSLYQTLKNLKEFGIIWNDLKHSNIMQRENGDLVITDVGLYIV